MLIFKCPECEDSTMGFNEADNSWVCTEVDCQHEIEADEANALFESGDLIGITESDEDDDDIEEDDDEEEDDEEEDDDSEDDSEEDDEDEKDESFNGFSNRSTWTTNLIVHNEYKLQKGALAAIRESADNSTDALAVYVKDIAKKDEYAPVFENVDLDEVEWSEIETSVNDSAAEFDQVRQDLNDALGVNESISEEDRNSIVTVFESALIVRYNELKNNLEEKHAADLESAKDANFKQLTSEMSGFLEEAIQEWMEENKLAIENAIQTEQTKSFLEALRVVFEDHYIEVPEGRYDILEDMANKIEQQDEELSAATAREAELQSKLDESVKKGVIAKLSEELTDTQVEKLVELAGSLDYESEEQFESALGVLKESFLRKPTNRKEGDVINADPDARLNEDDDDDSEVDFNDPIAMASYGLRKTDQ